MCRVRRQFVSVLRRQERRPIDPQCEESRGCAPQKENKIVGTVGTDQEGAVIELKYDSIAKDCNFSVPKLSDSEKSKVVGTDQIVLILKEQKGVPSAAFFSLPEQIPRIPRLLPSWSYQSEANHNENQSVSIRPRASL